MPLWSWNGERFRVRDLAGSLRGLDCFLCCPGPSLKDVDDAGLHVPGAVVVAVNTAYPRIRPDVWIGMDRPECYDPRLLAEPFAKLLGSRYRDEAFAGRMIREHPNVCFISGTEGRPHEMFGRTGPDVEFIWNGNTFQTALHVAVWLGCMRINLVGCDFGGTSDYHDARVLAEWHKRRNCELYARLVDELPMIRLEAQSRGVQIVSCTPGSPANEHLRYVPLAEAIRRTGENLPALPTGPVLDATDAELCRWGRVRQEHPGVLTGCDSAQEWMLPWWWANYSRHNAWPVAFADFGMSGEARAWCAERGTVLSVQALRLAVWFRKPLAMLASPFRWSLWLDLDCEVRGELGEAFAYADQGLAVTADPYRRLPVERDDGPVLAAGVVGVRHGDPVVQLWVLQMLRELSRIRDDQVALNLIRRVAREPIVLMPRRFQWLRLDGDSNPEALVMHWTGPAGKEHIRGQLEAATDQAGTTRAALCGA